MSSSGSARTIEPRHAIAYHFFNEEATRYAIFEGVRETYEGPVSMATDNMVWNISKDAITEQQREAAFVEGPNEIVNIVTGADLLEVRSRMLIGEDFDNLQMSAEEAEKAAREWS